MIFSKDFVNKDSYVIDIHMCGREKCKPGHFWGSGMRPYFLLHYVMSGKGIYETGGNRYNLHAGDIFLISPGSVVYYEADKKDPWEYTWTHFLLKNSSDIFQNTHISAENPVCGTAAIPLAAENFLKIAEFLETGQTNELYYTACVYNILGALMKPKTETPFKSRQYAEFAAAYIEANCHRAVTVEEIAGRVGINRKYLYKLFTEYAGISPMQYVLKVKIRRACTLLNETSATIGDIARSVGYDDIFTFSRMFTKHMGISPSAYRKRK